MTLMKVYRVGAASGIVVMLFFTFRLWEFSYFWIDDFNNLFWVQQENYQSMLLHLFNPLSDYFRPVGMFCYWALLQIFGLNAAAYHWFAWSLHTVNVMFVYLILHRLTRSRAGAIVGAALFGFQAVFHEIYWSFGTIFDLTAGLFFFAGILLWMHCESAVKRVLLGAVILIFAVKGKEMAITLPLIWFLYDWIVRRNSIRTAAFTVALPTAIAIVLTIQKMSTLGGTAANHPYYMDFSTLTFGRGYGWYLNKLFDTDLRWQKWVIGSFVLSLGLIARHLRRAIFCFAYVFAALLPVVFMVNHRFEFYWYIPLLGVCGMVGLITASVTEYLESRFPERALVSVGLVGFLILCLINYQAQKTLSSEARRHQLSLADEYRSFITGLRALPAPATNETIYYSSVPRFFDPDVLLSATQVAFRRTDIRAKLVDGFPADAKYRVTFSNQSVTLR
jgi:hypothetical protein